MPKDTILFLLLLFFSTLCHPQTAYIIVPGTWAGEHGWHSVGGDFFEALQKTVDEHASVINYYW